MASFRKRPGGSWEAQIRKKGFPTVARNFRTKAEAEAWAKMNESEMSRGVWLNRSESESTTLREALDRYEREITPRKKSASKERSFLKFWRETALADRMLSSVRSTDIGELCDLWQKVDKKANSTVVRRIAVLSHVFTIAQGKWGMQGLVNPTSVVEKPVVRDARNRRVEAQTTDPEMLPDELSLTLAATESEQLPAFILIAVETAMRRSEIHELTWENIDLKTRVIYLPDTKNNNERWVPLSSIAVAAIESLRKENETHERIFDMTPDAVSRAFRRALLRARKRYEETCHERGVAASQKLLIGLRLHDLRHEGTTMLAKEFDMLELSHITGHKDPRTLKRYFNPRAEDFAKRLP